MKIAKLMSRMFCVLMFFFNVLYAQGWQQYGYGGALPSLYAISAVNDSVCWFAGDLMMTFLVQTHSTGNSYTWSQNGLEPAQYTAIYGRSSTLAYTGSGNGRLFKTTNGGSSWSKQFTQSSSAFIDGIYFWTDSVGIAYGDPTASPGPFIVIRTTDGGTTWNDISSSVPSVTAQYGVDQTFDAVGTHVWFPSFSNSDSTVARYLYHSRDRGLTWERLNVPTNFANFSVSFSDSSNGLITNWYNKIARTTDGGKTWSVKYNGVGGGPLQIQKGTSNVWVQGYYDSQASNTPMFYSSDFGSTWGRQARNSPVSLTGISVSSQNVVWACGYNYLILRNTTPRVTTAVVSQTNAPAAPALFELSQNFPNPFNPTTTIKYRVEQSGLVHLSIFDELGKEVRTLIDESQNAGWHQMVWDGRDNSNRVVATGVYFYSIMGQSNMQAKKMLLLK